MLRGCSWEKWVVILFIAMVPHAISAQDLEDKLDRRVDFIPWATNAREQLVQVAQHYKIPMGIEWVLETNEKQTKPVPGNNSTVMTLLNSILQSAPNYSMTVRNGVVNVSDYRYTVDSRNFLNLRIDEFPLIKGNVYDAEANLRLAIKRKLHPEHYVGGSNGGYGYGVPDEDGLDVQNISLSGKDLTVRDILDRIVLANGNTLWLVDIAPSRMMKKEPFFACDAEQERGFVWKIIPFGKSTQN